LNDTDIVDITRLHDEGVQIEVRRGPKEKPVDCYEIGQKLKSEPMVQPLRRAR
jgi:mannose/fructose/N-acetylgalactosamine-specific phosphotransferase system component IIB